MYFPQDNDFISPVRFKNCVIDPCTQPMWWCWLFVNHNIQFKIADIIIDICFEKNVTAIGSSAIHFMIACLYRSPCSCSDVFFGQLFNLFEYLSSVTSSFLCVVISISILIKLDSVKFQNCLQLYHSMFTPQPTFMDTF